jgi:PAS domain-containing protein
MAEKPTYKELEQRVRALEKEALERKRADDALLESTRRLRVAYDQSIIYAQELAEQISERKQREKELQKARDALEKQVDGPTAELKQEIAERRQAEEGLFRLGLSLLIPNPISSLVSMLRPGKWSVLPGTRFSAACVTSISVRQRQASVPPPISDRTPVERGCQF